MHTRLASLAAAAILLPSAAVATTAAAVAAAPGGDNGTIKLSEVGGAEDSSNDPTLSCSFEVQWFGFDAGDHHSSVSFAGQGADAGVGITVTGATSVFIGEDAAGGGTDHDATQVYSLAFDAPAANAGQGYLVKVTTDNAGSQGADTKFKVVHVTPCGADGGTTAPAEPTAPVVSDPSAGAPALLPWSWDWTYAPPTCSGLSVDYPANLPEGQANDANVRVETASGPLTLNFHNDRGTWSGRTRFTFHAHHRWPAGLTTYDVVWVQVAGTNYHWQGDVACGPGATSSTPAAGAPAPTVAATSATPAGTAAGTATGTAPAAAPQVNGYHSGTTKVRRGAAPRADWVAVGATSANTLALQQLKKGAWRTISTAAILGDGSAKVTYPRLSKRGTYRFRVAVDGAASQPLTVSVR